MLNSVINKYSNINNFLNSFVLGLGIIHRLSGLSNLKETLYAIPPMVVFIIIGFPIQMFVVNRLLNLETERTL